MDFIERATPRHAMCSCGVCDSDIEIGQSIRVDEDEGLHVQHAWCFDAVRLAVANALQHAAKVARGCPDGQSAADAIHLQMRCYLPDTANRHA